MKREDVIQLARECGFSVGIGSPALPKFTALIEKAMAEERERLDFIEEHCRCDPKMDGQHVWWPTSFNTAQLLKGPTLREAIDNAIRARKDNT